MTRSQQPHAPAATETPAANAQPIAAPTTVAQEVAHQGLHFLGKSLPYIADALVIFYHLIGNRQNAQEMKALKQALFTGQAGTSGIDLSQGRLMLEHLQRGEFQQAQEAGIKAGFAGLGLADEGEMIWAASGMLGFFQGLKDPNTGDPAPDYRTPHKFNQFLAARSDDELSRFRVALSKIPDRTEQVHALVRLAKQIVSAPNEAGQKNELHAFLRTYGVAHNPNPITAGIARGMKAADEAAEERFNKKRKSIERDIQALLNRP